MQAIIDLTNCPKSNIKVAGLSILKRHLLCLSRNNVIKTIIIGSEKNDLKKLSSDKRITIQIETAKDIKEAIEKSICDTFVIAEDVVYSTNIYDIDIQDKKPKQFCDKNLYYLSFSDLKKFNSIDEINKHNPQSINNVKFCESISSKKDVKNAEKKMISSLRTSGDTLISRLMNRRMSLWVTSKIMHINITPNMITTFNLLLALIGVGCIWFMKGYWKTAIAGLLFNLSSIFDGCDGEIARLKFQGSSFGAKYDDFVDDFTNYTFFVGAALYTSMYWINTPLTWICTISGSIIYGLGKLLQFWLLAKQKGKVTTKTQTFFFEQKKEEWGKNPIKWLWKILRNVVRNDFLATLAMIAGFLQLFWVAPYLVAIFGTGLTFSVIAEFINYLNNEKKRRKEYSKIKVVVFDWDGTLLPTMETFADIAANRINHYYNIDFKVARKLYIDTSGIPFFMQMDKILPGGNFNTVCVDEFEKEKLNSFFEEEIPEEVNYTINELKKKNIKVFVSSGNFQDLIEKYLKDKNLNFDEVLGFKENFAKGHEHFSYILEKTGIKKNEMLFVGDSLKDGEKAEDFGIHFIGKTGIFNQADFEKTFDNVLTVKHVSKIPKIIRKAHI